LLQGFQYAERHPVIGGEHGVDLRVLAQEFLHRSFGVGLLVVADPGAEHLNARKLGEGALVSAHAFAVGRCRRGAFDDDDLSFAPEMFEQIARFPVSDFEVVGADIGNEAAGQGIGNQHDRNFRFVELLDRIDHGDVIDGNEDDGVRSVLQDLLHHRLLFADIVGLLRNEVQDSRPRRARNLVGGDAERFISGVGRVLGEHGDGHFIGRLGAACE